MNWSRSGNEALSAKNLLKAFFGRWQPLCTERARGSSWASFYILCPIPETEQYDEFLAEGRITETNLDWLDTTCLAWRHPEMSRERMLRLLFHCYRKFFSFGHALRNVGELSVRQGRLLARSVRSLAMPMFSRYGAWRQEHPMSGGVRRVQRDGIEDYLSLRQRTYGFELAPLPRSLQLPEAERLLQPGREIVPALKLAGRD